MVSNVHDSGAIDYANWPDGGKGHLEWGICRSVCCGLHVRHRIDVYTLIWGLRGSKCLYIALGLASHPV